MENNIQFAAIDIGSNAVRLLIKSYQPSAPDEGLRKELMVRVPLRLGQESFVSGQISDNKSKKLTKLMRAFKHLMFVYDVTEYRACATSAMRDASNSGKLVKEIEKKTGIAIEIITGQEEALIIYESHFADSLDQELNHLYVDVGGGSTEISLISNGNLQKSQSYNIGTVRLLNGMVKDTELERMRADLHDLKSTYKISDIIGSGGNIIKLQSLSKNGKKNSVITLHELERINKELKMYPVDERMLRFKLKPDRADVITHAADIYIEAAKASGCQNIIVPAIGLADGINHLLYSRFKSV